MALSGDVTIALDAMGGDQAPKMVVKGAAIALKRYPGLRFLMVGDEPRLRALMKRRKKLLAATVFLHTDEVVPGSMRPSVALRQGRKSSMGLALRAVREGRARAVVSAGNTGALMAMARMMLGMLPGIDRPAIAATMPTLRGETVVLDLGANTECDVRNLIQFAIMGELFARIVLGYQTPSVGLLNVGEEEVKGLEVVREAAARLKTIDGIRFHGFVEGDDIAKGTVDVVVTDGFTGNIALKTAEGTAKLYSHYLKSAFRRSLLARIGYLFARASLKALQKQTDPRHHNGAMFLGLGGIAVKSHGGTDALGFANAIGVAYDLVAHGFNDRISGELKRIAAGQIDGASVQQKAATA